MFKAKKTIMYIDVKGVDDMTDRRDLMKEITRNATISSDSKTMTCAALHGTLNC